MKKFILHGGKMPSFSLKGYHTAPDIEQEDSWRSIEGFPED